MSIDSSFVAGFILGAVFVLALMGTIALTERPTRNHGASNDN